MDRVLSDGAFVIFYLIPASGSLPGQRQQAENHRDEKSSHSVPQPRQLTIAALPRGVCMLAKKGFRFESANASNLLFYLFKFTTMTPPSASTPPRMPSSVGTSPSQKKPIKADTGETK